jgi:hypothetical protein
MKADYSERAGKTLAGLPSNVRKAFFKQVRYLEQDLSHPSLRGEEIWRNPERVAGPGEQGLAFLLPD